jgi:hypothetical protein
MLMREWNQAGIAKHLLSRYPARQASSDSAVLALAGIGFRKNAVKFTGNAGPARYEHSLRSRNGGSHEQDWQRKRADPKRPKAKLGLPDLDHSRSAVLDSLRSPDSKRGYRHALDEFIEWYCSERRLSFNKTVVTRYRIHLEKHHFAAGTINGRLAAVWRLAYEAADVSRLSPELAASIRRVEGVQKLGVRLGNWLTADEARRLWQAPDPETLKGK